MHVKLHEDVGRTDGQTGG